MTTTIKNILVKDDNEILGSSIALHLHRQGFSVWRTCDVEQAKSTIEAAEKAGQPFDLVISDILMPNQSGVALITWLHAHHPEVAVLVLSGFGNADLLKTLIRPGRDSFQKNPVLPQEVMTAIHSIEKKAQERLEQVAMVQEPGKVLFLKCHSEKERCEFHKTKEA